MRASSSSSIPSSRPSFAPRATRASCSGRSRTCGRTPDWFSTHGSSKLREIKLKLPKSLGFGDAQAFDKGLKSNITGGKAFITNGARKLKVTLPGGADKVVVKVGKGGVVRKGDGKPRFRVQVLDVDDTRTSLTLPKGKKKGKKKK